MYGFAEDKMKKQARFLLMVLNVLMVLSACTFSSMSDAVSPASPDAQLAALPFEGIWVSEGDAPAIIVFTKDSMYWVESDQVSADQMGTRERFAEIVSYDLENSHITLLTKWIRVSGLMVGFDAPNFNITYSIEDDTLRVGVGWDGEFAVDADPVAYFRK